MSLIKDFIDQDLAFSYVYSLRFQITTGKFCMFLGLFSIYCVVFYSYLQ